MKLFKGMFSAIGYVLGGISFVLFGIGMDCVVVFGEFLILFIIGIINLFIRIKMIDELISWVNSHMLYSCLILMVANAILFVISKAFGGKLEGETTSNYSKPSYTGKSFSEYYEDELNSIREKEQLEELKKINSKLS